MEAYRGCGGITPPIRNLSSTWRWVVNFTPPVPTEQETGCAPEPFWKLWLWQSCLTADGLGQGFLGYPTCGLLTIPVELSRLPWLLHYNNNNSSKGTVCKTCIPKTRFHFTVSFSMAKLWHIKPSAGTAAVLRGTIKWTLCTTDFRKDQYVFSSELFYLRLFVCSAFRSVSVQSNYWQVHLMFDAATQNMNPGVCRPPTEPILGFVIWFDFISFHLSDIPQTHTK